MPPGGIKYRMASTMAVITSAQNTPIRTECPSKPRCFYICQRVIRNGMCGVAERAGQGDTRSRQGHAALLCQRRDRGRGFAVHGDLDQIGAVIGPLTVAARLFLTGGRYGPAHL
jgi:hypothetical protein